MRMDERIVLFGLFEICDHMNPDGDTFIDLFQPEIFGNSFWVSSVDDKNKTGAMCIPTLTVNVTFDDDPDMYIFTISQPKCFMPSGSFPEGVEDSLIGSIATTLCLKVEDEEDVNGSCRRAFDKFSSFGYHYVIVESYIAIRIDDGRIQPYVTLRPYWKEYNGS